MAVDLPPVVLKFGAGVNTRARHADVNVEEAVTGENFDLDAQSSAYRPRRPFSLITTATNAGSINGFAQLLKNDGTVSTLIQSASDVVSWDGATTFATVGHIADPDAKLRGTRDQNWGLDEKVIITDLTKSENVKEWDGTTFGDMTTTGLTNFKAKYCRVIRDRAVFANCAENGVDLPHSTVFSKVEDETLLTITDKPSSALGLDDPVILTTPDLKPVNGFEVAFGTIMISTQKGRLFELSGDSSFDFSWKEFHTGSSVDGDESLVSIGNDVVIARAAAIDLLSSTIKFGDVELNDVSRWIAPSITKTSSWTVVYDRSKQRVLCFPNNQSAVWVIHKDILFRTSPKVSPWSRWVTNHESGLVPTAAWSMVDPVTNLDAVYFGDENGNIYQFDSVDEDQDGGSDSVVTTRRTALIALPQADKLFNITGWIDYRKQREATVELSFLFGGVENPTTTISMTIPGSNAIGQFYNSSDSFTRALYNDDDYYSAGYENTLRRQPFKISGQGSYFQVEATVTSIGPDWEIEEIGLDIEAA